jgi:hypothetical protein
MYALLAMALALALLVALMHLKIRLGRAMLLSAVCLAVLLKVTPIALWQTALSEWHNKPLSQTTGCLFVSLTALVILVNVLGTAMKDAGVSQRLAPALENIFKSRRLALTVIPMMMGLLPTPGGIMLSAPMVRDLGDHIGVDRSRLAAINFLFRHQWETVWPLFPSVPLIQGMFGISAFALISHNLAITLAGTISGVIFLLLGSMPPKDATTRPPRRLAHDVRDFTHALWPIALVMALYMILELPPAIGLLVAIVLFLLFHRLPIRSWWPIFKSGLELDFALLIFGALLFKLNLETGQAIDSVVQFLNAVNMPRYAVIFLLPFIVAFLTGVTMPTVAITFPFLAAYIGSGQHAKIALETLAFAGLMCGLLLTPVHLCLALSASYFETPLMRIVVRLLAPTACVAAAGFMMAVLFA